MKPLFFILRKSFKNYIKDLKHKPAALIGYIIGLVFIILMIVLSIKTPSGNVRSGSEETFGAIISGVLIFMMYTGIKQGISRGSTFFRFADVNLVFTAPISPKKVLVYGVIKQFTNILFMMLFLLLQIPNLKNFYNIKSYGVFIILIGAFVLIFSMSVFGVLIYSITSKSKKRRRVAEKILNGVLIVLGIGFLSVLFQVKDVKKAVLLILNGEYFYNIPFLGWFKQFFIAALIGVTKEFYVSIGLIAVFLVIIIIILYKLNTDYYEDVLAATEFKEEFIKVKKQGRAGYTGKTGKLRKAKQTYKGSGAKAIFYRHLLEYKKAGYFFLNRTSLIMFISGIGFGYFFKHRSIDSILYFSVYMLFLFSNQGKWVQELSKPYIYLIPASSESKVFYATLADNIKNVIDGLILFTAAGIILKANIVSIVLCALVFMTFGSLFIYADVLSRKLFGGTHSRNLEFFIKFFVIIVAILPGFIVSIVFRIRYSDTLIGEYIQYLILIGYNLVVSCVLLLVGKRIFEKLEMK